MLQFNYNYGLNEEYEDKNLYHEDGNCGCVNTPYDAVSTIYNNVLKGTKVLVHKQVNR